MSLASHAGLTWRFESRFRAQSQRLGRKSSSDMAAGGANGAGMHAIHSFDA
jgi:lipoprotein-anchoring transpeptidase ErfK/SrfK